MTATPAPAAGAAPVPWEQRQTVNRLLASLRLNRRELAEGDPDKVLRPAYAFALHVRWATVDYVAAELAHHLGSGWGAAYRLYVHEQQGHGRA